VLFNSRYPEEEVKKERGVIMEEIKMYQDNPMMGLSSEVVKWLWGSSPIGCWNISGELGDIEGVERKKVVDYHQELFNTGEMVVVMAGNVAEDDVGMVERFFGNGITGRKKLPEVKIKWNSEKRKIINRQVEQGHLGLMVPTFGSHDERRYPLRVLNVALTGNTSSRLFEEVRSKRGWAYYVFPIGESVSEDGFWGVQAGVPREKAEVAAELIEREMVGFGKGLKPEEVERAKAYLRGKTELKLDESDFWSGFVGSRILLEGKLVSPEEELNRLNGVQYNEVVELANEIFRKERIRSLVMMKNN
jgi:predicted Zn-dependent peptidase